MAKHSTGVGKVQILSDRECRSLEQLAIEAGGNAHGLIPRDYRQTPQGSFCAPFNLPTIPRNEWRDRIKEREKNKARMSDLFAHFKRKVKNQSQTPLCWSFSATSTVESAILTRHRKLISLSPASVGQLIQGVNGMAGGWSSNAIKKIAEAGICPSSLWPDTKYGRQYDNAETKAARKAYMLTEWLDLKRRSFDQLMTALLMNFTTAIGLNWWSHAIMAVDPIVEGNDDFGVLIENSWGAGWKDGGYSILMESKATPDDAVCPNVTLMQVA